ncbi:NUDIX domain-containing protein [Niveispirillum sp.]|uniref:NUDIX domain-containing protein n=1 Tax=Niveispirillum sp. TaxID=1917217 RepID=UPI001B6AD6C4|nr:NUDIX domain-containing protein [Niveispirillum sp.]MBP7336404.1 NUDIX domain-containing protein [Niveispirillum sp.]
MRLPIHPPLPGQDSPTQVEVADHTFLHQGFMQFSVMKLRHEKFAGGMTPVIERDICHRGHAVVIVLYDPRADLLVMVEQFRIGAYAAGVNPWMLEFVAGMVKPGEDPAEVAIREAAEEAGCVPSDVHQVYSMMPSPGGCTELVEFFTGLVDSTGIGGIHGLEEEVEDIRVHLVPAETAIAELDENRVPSGLTLLGLSWFARHRDRLRTSAGVD